MSDVDKELDNLYSELLSAKLDKLHHETMALLKEHEKISIENAELKGIVKGAFFKDGDMIKMAWQNPVEFVRFMPLIRKYL